MPVPLSEVASSAHAQRKIYDVHVESKSPPAAQALEMIARLFAIEAEFKGRPPSGSPRVALGRRRSSLSCAPLRFKTTVACGTVSLVWKIGMDTGF